MKNGAGILITAALIVLAIRMWMQLRGKTTTPFNEWAIGYGALFFILALATQFEPAFAWVAMIVALADFLKNGVSLTTDVSNLVTGAETGNTFVAEPFAAGSQASTMASTNGGQPAAGKTTS